MSLRDALAVALAGVRRRPGRTALTIAAVALASALLTSLLTIARTAEDRVLSELADGGPLTGITVVPAAADASQLASDAPRGGDPRPLDAEAVRRIAALSSVEAVLPVVSQRMFVVLPDHDAAGGRLRPFDEQLVGVDLARPSLLPVSVLAGRLPAAGSTAEVAVGQGWLDRLGLDPVDAPEVLGSDVVMAAGRRLPGLSGIRGRWTRVRVVGVVAQEVGSGELLGSLELAQAARDWAVAGPEGGSRFGTTRSPYSAAFAVAAGIDRIGDARGAIADVGYTTRAPENLIEAVRRYLRVVGIVLAGVGLIALSVAALGVANALLAAVRERRREIGVLKAIGARDRDVQRIFVVEAALVGVVGGVLGALAGWGAARLVGEVVNRTLVEQGLAPVALRAPVPVLLASVAGTTLLALVAGTWPARRAARLPAHEAVQGG